MIFTQCSHPMAMKWAFIKTEGKILPKGVQIFWKFSRIIILRAQPKLCRLGVQAAFACIFSDGLELHKRLISLCTSEPYLVHVSISAYRADRPTIRQAEASVFPSFFSQLKKLIIFLFEFSLPGT